MSSKFLIGVVLATAVTAIAFLAEAPLSGKKSFPFPNSSTNAIHTGPPQFLTSKESFGDPDLEGSTGKDAVHFSSHTKKGTQGSQKKGVQPEQMPSTLSFIPEKAGEILKKRGRNSRAGQRLLKWLHKHQEVMKTGVKGPFSFIPLMESGIPGSQPPCAPVKLPKGFSQSIIIQEKNKIMSDCDSLITLDVVGDRNDRPDMNVVNETGGHVGRYLYRTHELREDLAAISAIDLQTGLSQVYTASDSHIAPAWNSLDGIEWTPWGTLLIAEESGESGRLFECDVDGLILNCVDRPAVGRRDHEGLVVAPNGNLYGVDEFNGGSIYRFIPDRYGDLSAGTLYALNIPGSTTVCSGETGEGVTPTGQAEWIALIPGQNGVVTDPAVNSRAAADEAGASDFCRPEDAERIGSNLYIAATTTTNILQIPINTETPVVTEYAGINTNMNNEDQVMEFGLHFPDNLASDRAGNLYIVEDNPGQSDVWVATKDRNHDGMADNVYLFATVTSQGAVGTGIYFPPTMPKTMLINVAHKFGGNDMTIAITKD